MKTSKAVPSDLSSSRRAQPLRQTRNNPPRSSIPGARTFGSRGSLSGGLEEKDIEIFPAITHFADAITALPKELVRHFTLLKEVDAKIFAPEEQLHRLIADALDAPPPQRPQLVETQHVIGPTSTSMSAQGSANGSIMNGNAGSSMDLDAYSLPNAAVYDPANIPRRQLFQNCAITMQNMLVSLDEKNHVISTAAEALNKQLARIDDCFPFIELEISEEARYGSTTHWAYPENRAAKTASGGGSRREIASVNSLSAAAQHLVEEAAARSDARKQALLERKKGKIQQAESDFDDHHDGRHKEKKLHGNSKVRKAADSSSSVGLGITNGATNGNPPKRRKVEKGPAGGAVMERSMSGVLGSNGAVTKGKGASPRATPGPDGAKKRSRAAATTNGQTRKRNNTITSVAMSPSLASSPTRSTFPDSKSGRPSPPPTNGGRPAPSRVRQNSTQLVQEKRPPSSASNKQNGTSTPNLEVAAIATGRSITEVKASMKELATNAKGEHLLEDADQDDPEMSGALVVGNRKDSTAKREGSEANGDALQGIQSSTVTTKSGRASKPSTPAIPSFPEPVRSRSSRNALDSSSSNKRSHKKGAGAAAQQQLLAAQQNPEVDDAAQEEEVDEDGEIDADEPTYCYCNGVSYGEMVGCDANDCEREWFHLECVGLKVAPKGNAKWYCDDCKEKLKNKRFGSR